MARALAQGVVVAIADRQELDLARKSMAQFDNVMFIEAQAEQIPWREAYFTKVIVPHHLEPFVRSAAAELQRLLAPDGEIVRDSVEG